MARGSKTDVVSIRYLTLLKAIKDLQPTLVEMYYVYGLNVTLEALSYMAVKGVMLEDGLTTRQRKAILKKTKASIDSFSLKFSQYLKSGSENAD